MGSIVHRSVPTNLKWFPTCSHAHAMFQDRFKDVQVGSRWFSTLYILSPNFHSFWGCDMTLGMPSAASKVHQKQWNHKKEEGWHKYRCAELGGPPLEVQILCTFPTAKTGMEQIDQFNMSPGVDFHPVKEYQFIYSIYLKPDEPFVNVRAQRVQLCDSRRLRKKAQVVKQCLCCWTN